MYNGITDDKLSKLLCKSDRPGPNYQDKADKPSRRRKSFADGHASGGGYAGGDGGYSGGGGGGDCSGGSGGS